LINHQNYEDGATPLHWAAQDNREKNLDLLLAKGATALTDHMGETALHLAAMNGFLGCAQLLCTPESVNMVSSEGNSPLHLATLNSNKRLVAYLLSQGADPDLQNKKKDTPRGIAAAKKDKQLLDYFDPEKLRLLEEIEKARDIHEELIGQNVDLKNAVETETRKRESAYTVIKLGDDKITDLETRLAAVTADLASSKQIQEEQAQTIADLNGKLEQSEAKAFSLQQHIDTATTSLTSAPRTSQDFPSELIYSRVKETQSELQKLARFLEDSSQALLTTKTAINQLEESFGL
jgi:ankyrin repeat protein